VYFLIVVAVGGLGSLRGPFVPRCSSHRRYKRANMDSRVRRLPHLRRNDRHPAVAAAGFVRSARMMHSGGYTVDSRIRWPEWLPWIAALAAFFLLPEYLSLGARILIYILFALSLD